MKDQTEAEIRVVETAKRASVKRLVKLSVLGAETEAYSFARIHRTVERTIENSGIPYTFLRPGSFMQNFVTYYGDTIRKDNAFYLPCRNARENHIDVRDIAGVAARTLTGGHEGKAYNLIGPQALTYAEAAAIISKAVGRTITYIDMPEAEFRTALATTGMSEPDVENLLDLYRFLREEAVPLTSTAIKDVTGRDPTPFAQFARDYAAAWKQ